LRRDFDIRNIKGQPWRVETNKDEGGGMNKQKRGFYIKKLAGEKRRRERETGMGVGCMI
jgi:hypothetical protein